MKDTPLDVVHTSDNTCITCYNGIMCHFEREGGFVLDGRRVFLHPVRLQRVLGYGAARFCVRRGISGQMFGTNALWAWEGCLKSTNPKD